MASAGPAAKRPCICREQLIRRLQKEGVHFRAAARLPALLEMANKHGLLTLDWPPEPQVSRMRPDFLFAASADRQSDNNVAQSYANICMRCRLVYVCACCRHDTCCCYAMI